MAQYRSYTSVIFISDTVINITSTFSGGNQISTNVTRDGSMDANFKTACAAHRDSVLSLKPTSTSPACYLAQTGKWFRSLNATTLAGTPVVVKVPTGNSGVLVLKIEPSGSSGTMKYKKNAGAFTTFVDGDTVTVADGDTFSVEVTGLTSSDYINGSVLDQDTGIALDNYSFMNTTP